MRRPIALAGFVITLAALLTQLGLTIEAFFALGYRLVDALAFNFAYFTILVGCFVAGCFAADLWPRARWLSPLRRPEVVGFGVPAVLLVVSVAALLLGTMRVRDDLFFWIAPYTLHYATPPIFLVWWGAYLADGSLKFSLIPAWLLPPAIYLGLVFMRGAMQEVYPYPFFDISRIGSDRVALFLAVFSVGFVLLCALTVLADRRIGTVRANRTRTHR